MAKEIGVGFLGAGTVGAGALEVLLSKREKLARDLGAELVVRRVLVRDLEKERPIQLPAGLLTTDPADVLGDPTVEVVVELIGGEEPACAYIQQALEAGKHVVTANKEVIAKHGAKLLSVAAANDVNLFFEASVGGGIPVISTLRHDLVANEMHALEAIINGTTNYILSDMATGRDYASALADAQRLGYAEADPKNDVEGIDASYKLAILATLAFHSEVRPIDLVRVGITRLHPNDFSYAAEMGYVVKLIAWARLVDGQIEAAVYPMLIPQTHSLAAVRGVFNAILLDGDQIDKLMLYGRGAGSRPTASAVVADLCRVAHNLTRGVTDRVAISSGRDTRVRPFGELTSRFYLRMQAADKPGVLAQIARVLGENEISIASFIQRDPAAREGIDGEAIAEPSSAELVITTHRATEDQMARALAAFGTLEVVYDVSSFIRVQG